METVGIRALKQNASEVVARAVGGEVIEITDRGRPVARLVPLRDDPYQELVDRGLITPPSSPDGLEGFKAARDLHVADLVSKGLPTGNISGQTSQQILDDLRADRL